MTPSEEVREEILRKMGIDPVYRPGPGEVVISLIVSVLLVVPLLIFHGFVLTKVWLYFMVWGYNFNPISIPMALGLSTIASVFTGTNMLKTKVLEKKKDESLFKYCIKVPLYLSSGYSFIWLFAWIVMKYTY